MGIYAIAILGIDSRSDKVGMFLTCDECVSEEAAIGLGHVIADERWHTEGDWWHRVVAAEVLVLTGAEEAGE